MIRGSIVALVTPMTQKGELDWESLERLIEFHLDQHTDAIVAVGTTGESATLNEQEHCEVIARVVNLVAGKIPVIAGTGSNSTQEAIELSAKAAEVGADACLLVTPYYNKPTQQGLYLHYQKIADTVDIPHILYNVPGRTHCDLLPETVMRLASHPNIIGLKEATGEIDRVSTLKQTCPDDFLLYSGDDASACEFCLQGGDGVISVTANVAPRLMSEMIATAIKGDRANAEILNNQLAALNNDLFIESNPIPVKWALHAMGLIPEGIRLPLTPLSLEHETTVRQAMNAASVH
ncbi:MAG: 4-hydroxy-tetrahydrodipicolinate synthase [Gammaproteobacteria bacterium]|nr:4-hydroxy-tetrahydrodipicolinate synthase [Gammaproteobacteria bacterium]